ncbi:hypothetical protein FCX76_16625 [Escherichia coli]|nr:hypothetical protein [Escherichia coli]EFD4400240.1 hypothetical protein [Escherichia coli]EFD5524135.1 hypothetical protein [Escherichia coli]EFN9334740.1 hypothetical protein [Escherichia coli]EFO0102544.1 hypothetical protein [Escherichia coli]
MRASCWLFKLIDKNNQSRMFIHKSPLMRAFVSLGSRGSFAYPFLSPHRLIDVLMRLLTSCFS